MLNQFLNDNTGTTAIEYGLIAALITVATMAIILFISVVHWLWS